MARTLAVIKGDTPEQAIAEYPVEEEGSKPSATGNASAQAGGASAPAGRLAGGASRLELAEGRGRGLRQGSPGRTAAAQLPARRRMMAITRPPTPPSFPPPPEQPPGPRGRPPPPRRVRTPSTLGRVLPVAALALVVLIIAYLIFSGRGTTTYQLLLPNAYQLVRGNTVQVGGVPVGSVTNIVLTTQLPGEGDDPDQVLAGAASPRHDRRSAHAVAVERRQPLRLPRRRARRTAPPYPTGAPLPVTVSKTVTDLDELFNTFNPKTLKGLQGFLQGSAEQYAGAGRELGKATELFAPALRGDRPRVRTAHAGPAGLHPLPGRNRQGADDHRRPRTEQLTDLIENANTTFAPSATSRKNSSRACKSSPKRFTRGTKRSRNCPPR